MAGLLLAAVLGSLAAVALRSEPAPLSTVSNRGQRANTGFQPQGRGAPLFTQGFLLAKRGGWEFFRMSTTDGWSCWGVGTTYPEGDSVSSFGGCEPDGRFPSAERPLLDFSTVEQDERHPRLLRLVGFAADGVAQVGVIDGDDRVVPAARVFDNVYFAETLPSGDFYRLAALDRNGRIIWRSSPAS
jgi:hypothetical protein